MYTIVNESKYLLVFGVPRINLYQEIKQLFTKYGRISRIQKITDKLISNETREYFLLIRFSLLKQNAVMQSSYVINLQLKLSNSLIVILLNMKKFTLRGGPRHLSIVKISMEVFKNSSSRFSF